MTFFFISILFSVLYGHQQQNLSDVKASGEFKLVSIHRHSVVTGERLVLNCVFRRILHSDENFCLTGIIYLHTQK